MGPLQSIGPRIECFSKGCQLHGMFFGKCRQREGWKNTENCTIFLYTLMADPIKRSKGMVKRG
tara:strand:+ start:3604 stop:3792 length:189 start_codon:yes stop_codon:yes gene_type:complete